MSLCVYLRATEIRLSKVISNAFNAAFQRLDQRARPSFPIGRSARSSRWSTRRSWTDPSDVVDWEGCFSVPGLMGLVPRAERITVDYLSPDGQRLVEDCSGYVARVVQHEVDHLDGIEFVNRMTSMGSFTTVQNHITFHRGGPPKSDQ